MADVTIRPCRADECAAVLGLWRQSEATPSATDREAELRRLVREQGHLFLVAERDGCLLGTVIAGWDGWRGNVYRLAVLPSERRQGIATVLAQEAMRRLQAAGARRITALVEREHADAVAFWDALDGFQRDLRMVRYVGTV